MEVQNPYLCKSVQEYIPGGVEGEREGGRREGGREGEREVHYDVTDKMAVGLSTCKCNQPSSTCR